jgi:hypothetical protein
LANSKFVSIAKKGEAKTSGTDSRREKGECFEVLINVLGRQYLIGLTSCHTNMQMSNGVVHNDTREQQLLICIRQSAAPE